MLEIDRPVVQATAPVRDNVPDGSGVTPGRLRSSAALKEASAASQRKPTSPLGSRGSLGGDLLKEKLKILPLVPRRFVLLHSVQIKLPNLHFCRRHK